MLKYSYDILKHSIRQVYFQIIRVTDLIAVPEVAHLWTLPKLHAAHLLLVPDELVHEGIQDIVGYGPIILKVKIILELLM